MTEGHSAAQLVRAGNTAIVLPCSTGKLAAMSVSVSVHVCGWAGKPRID